MGNVFNVCLITKSFEFWPTIHHVMIMISIYSICFIDSRCIFRYSCVLYVSNNPPVFPNRSLNFNDSVNIFTILSRISDYTVHNSITHILFNGRCLVTATNSGDSSTSMLTPLQAGAYQPQPTSDSRLQQMFSTD